MLKWSDRESCDKLLTTMHPAGTSDRKVLHDEHDSMCLSVSKKRTVPDDGVYNALKCVRLGIDE
jgi:hypothetical protein